MNYISWGVRAVGCLFLALAWWGVGPGVTAGLALWCASTLYPPPTA